MGLKFDEICIDAHDATALGAWWSKVLGWPQDVDEDGDVVLHAPPGAGPNWLFVAVPDDKVVKIRIHFDFRPDDQRAEVDRVGRLRRAGQGAQPHPHGLGQLRHREADLAARVGGERGEGGRRADDGDPPTLRQRLQREQLRGLEQLCE